MKRASLFLFLSMFVAAGAFAAPPVSPFLLRYGAIVDPVRGAAYVAKPNGTIDAIDLGSGRTLWSSADAALPIGADHDLLVAQVEEKPAPTQRFQVAILDAASGRKVSQATLTLPAEARALVADREGEVFRATAEREGALFLVSWFFQENPVHAVAPKPDELKLDFFSGSVRISPQTGALIGNQGGRVGDVPARFKRFGAPPQAPWQAGGVAARAEGGRGGPLTLKRAEAASGRALPDAVLSKRALFALGSADQQHVLASERVGEGGPDDPEYRWVIFAVDTTERATELRQDVSAAPFFVFGDSVIYESRPHGYLRGGLWIDEPMAIRSVRLSTGVPKWNVEIRDLTDRGPKPPAR